MRIYHNLLMAINFADMLEMPKVSKQIRNMWYIAESTTGGPKFWNDDITNFDDI